MVNGNGECFEFVNAELCSLVDCQILYGTNAYNGLRLKVEGNALFMNSWWLGKGIVLY
jgi:hypothetical protein